MANSLAGLTNTRSEYDSLARLYVPVAVVVAVLVFGAIGFALFRYRASRSPRASRRHSMPLAEGVYALVLAGIAAVLVAATLRTESRVDALDPDPAVTIHVTAFRWGWRFDYPGGVSQVGDRSDPPILNVPTGETVRFELTSRDVIHSFWVPELRFKRDAFPGRTTSFDLDFDRDTIGRCAEFCGIGHDQMIFAVAAMSPAGFDSWLDAAGAQATEGSK